MKVNFGTAGGFLFPEGQGALTGEFITKDSGKRVEFASGMRRDTQEGKPRYDLTDKPMIKRWAELMARGADKYGANNWLKASSDDEFNRFKASAERHMMQWLAGDRDEDHAAAIFFNVAAYEHFHSGHTRHREVSESQPLAEDMLKVSTGVLEYLNKDFRPYVFKNKNIKNWGTK